MCHSSFTSCPLFSCLFCFSLPTHRSHLVFVRATGKLSNFTPKNINSPARLHAGDVIKVRCHRRHSAEFLPPPSYQHQSSTHELLITPVKDRTCFRRVSTPPAYSSGEAYAYLDPFGASVLSLTSRLHLYKRGIPNDVRPEVVGYDICAPLHKSATCSVFRISCVCTICVCV